jgi:hypothetical protein
MKKRKKSGFRTELNKREKKEAFQNLGKPKCIHHLTLCFGGSKFVKTEMELERAISRSEFKELEEYILEQFKPIFKGLTKVIIHN